MSSGVCRPARPADFLIFFCILAKEVVMLKRVYLEPTWKLHSGYHLGQLVPYPPEGYEFVVRDGVAEGISSWLSQRNSSHRLTSEAYRLAPLVLMKGWLDGLVKRVPEDIDLIFSCGLLVYRKQPWVIEIDAPWNPIGPNIRYFKWFKREIRRAFASGYCRKVLCFSEFSREALLSALDCSRFEHKIGVLPRAVNARKFTKMKKDDKIRLLFVGSANMAGEFEMRGGKEVLEAFRILSRNYRDLELVIRSDISPAIRRKYRDCLEQTNVRLIDWILPYSELEEIYRSADIFLFPGHYDNWLIFLEAMSYELPIIATNVYATPERVSDGETGFLLQGSKMVPYYQEGMPFFSLTPQFQRAIQTVDPAVVKELVEKTSILIEDEPLRRKMGRAARQEIEHGRFSIGRRNEALKGFFDESTV
jgi:glycosyltransferase involved in cell wall biosynthesis